MQHNPDREGLALRVEARIEAEHLQQLPERLSLRTAHLAGVAVGEAWLPRSACGGPPAFPIGPALACRLRDPRTDMGARPDVVAGTSSGAHRASPGTDSALRSRGRSASRGPSSWSLHRAIRTRVPATSRHARAASVIEPSTGPRLGPADHARTPRRQGRPPGASSSAALVTAALGSSM